MEVSPRIKNQIKELQEKTSATSLVEVFRNALALYDMVVDTEKGGGKLVLEMADGEREVIKLLI
ncbi:MAG: hypothetical protein EON58_19695 [Alphaproteobacteria bacterium]|nr:MAG: hypothetical protein EON58_19695 [Alphaproteobacteria bacterium]